MFLKKTTVKIYDYFKYKIEESTVVLIWNVFDT